jgi:hypothetical protein
MNHQNTSQEGRGYCRIITIWQSVRGQLAEIAEGPGILCCEAVIILERQTILEPMIPVTGGDRDQMRYVSGLAFKKDTSDRSDGVRSLRGERGTGKTKESEVGISE